MAARRFPIWIVTENKHVLNPPPNIPCSDPDAAHAFTCSERLTAFLDARSGGRWDVNLIADMEGLVVGVSDLHSQGVQKVCIDPEPDGTGGELIGIRELFAEYQAGQKE